MGAVATLIYTANDVYKLFINSFLKKEYHFWYCSRLPILKFKANSTINCIKITIPSKFYNKFCMGTFIRKCEKDCRI